MTSTHRDNSTLLYRRRCPRSGQHSGNLWTEISHIPRSSQSSSAASVITQGSSLPTHRLLLAMVTQGREPSSIVVSQLFTSSTSSCKVCPSDTVFVCVQLTEIITASPRRAARHDTPHPLLRGSRRNWVHCGSAPNVDERRQLHVRASHQGREPRLSGVLRRSCMRTWAMLPPQAAPRHLGHHQDRNQQRR